MNATLPPRIVTLKKRRDTRLRCPAHLKWVREHSCCVPGCTETLIEAAHVRDGTDGGTSLKPGDNWTISLCNFHHASQHSIGEPRFERRYDIDMKALAEAFWAAFKRSNPVAARRAEERTKR